MATIDIIIPVYNQAEKITECLRSLEHQTFQDFRIIIVDDGSTDNIKEVLENWLRAQNLRAKSPEQELSTKTSVFYQKHLGAPSARNFGAHKGFSEYILFCDADIFLDKNFLKKSLDTLKKNKNASYCYTSFRYGWKKFRLWHFDEAKLKEMPYIHTTSLMRKKSFPGFDENMKRLQDWDLWLTMMEHGDRGIWLPEYLFTVKVGGTMSKWIPKFFVRYLKRYKKTQEYLNAVQIVKKKHGLV